MEQRAVLGVEDGLEFSDDGLDERFGGFVVGGFYGFEDCGQVFLLGHFGSVILG